MSQIKFTPDEIEVLATARTVWPQEDQRKLARRLFKENQTIGFQLRHRSEASIYGALRRHDASRKALITQGIEAAHQRADGELALA